MQYSAVKRLEDGRRYLKVSTEEGTRVMVQLNGVTVVPKFSDTDDITLEVPTVQGIVDIDSANLTAAKENCQEWFGREVPEKTLEAAYTSSLKDTTMNVSKATVNGRVVTRVYGPDKSLMDSDDLTEMQKCNVILEYSGLWFAKKTFGPIWRLAQIRVKGQPKPVYPEEYMFQEDESEDENEKDNDSDYI